MIIFASLILGLTIVCTFFGGILFICVGYALEMKVLKILGTVYVTSSMIGGFFIIDHFL